MTVIRKIDLGSRRLEVRLSARAAKALAAESEGLTIELELYFSCLLRKRVNFLRLPHADAVACGSLNEHVRVCFRPVMTRACAVSEVIDEPDVEGFPLQRPQAFTPRWLSVDHRRGEWSGEFGF